MAGSPGVCSNIKSQFDIVTPEQLRPVIPCEFPLKSPTHLMRHLLILTLMCCRSIATPCVLLDTTISKPWMSCPAADVTIGPDLVSVG